jgi:hypothetical protein
MRNKITFHIALYCLLATATVGAMETPEIEEQSTQQILLQPGFYIGASNYGKHNENDYYTLLAENGSTTEKIETLKLSCPTSSISLVALYNQKQISDSQYEYLNENTEGFTQSINIKYYDEKNIVSEVSVIPTYRIYTPSEEITMDGSRVQVNIRENLLENNKRNSVVLSNLEDGISSTQLQELEKLIQNNNDVYVQLDRCDAFFHRIVKNENLTENINKIVQTNTKENSNHDEKIQKLTYYIKIKSFISSCLTQYKGTVVGIGAFIVLIIAAYKYNKLDGFIKFA